MKKKAIFPFLFSHFIFPLLVKSQQNRQGWFRANCLKQDTLTLGIHLPPPLPTRLESGMSIRAPVTAQEAQAPAVRWSSCEIRVMAKL